MRSGTTSFLGLNLLLLLFLSGKGGAQDAQPSEYQIKSAFLFNFAKFVDWPPAVFSSKTAPLVIGILGEDPFREELQKAIHNKSVDEHPIEIKSVTSAMEATNCHILFVSNSERAKLPQILESLKGSRILTVGEMDHFTESGGMINFVKVGTKIRFQINNAAATTAGLKISSKLLNLALRTG